MRRRNLIVLLLSCAGLVAGFLVYSQSTPPQQVAMPPGIAFRVLFGLADKTPTAWDGKATVSAGKILNIQGWRFAGQDAFGTDNGWKAATRNAIVSAGATGPGAVLENGVVITLSGEDPSAEVTIATLRGTFSFRPQDVPWGVPATFLSKQVRVDRVAPTWQLTTSPEEQDFPAIAQSGDDVWVSFVEFVHGDRSQVVTGQFQQEPKDFDFLARPAGGDQVQLLHYSKSKRLWTGPLPVSATGQDVMRTAVAVDGQNRVWVVWAANRDGNFDIHARAYAGGKWSDEQRLTWDPGTDVNPVATTDANGRVWVAWQGYRNNNLVILASALNGDSFTHESVVSESAASNWDPALAAAPGGEVAVSWDTYDKGNYDIYFRRLRFEQDIFMGSPVPVAVTAGFEARSSIAYDAQGRLWVAGLRKLGHQVGQGLRRVFDYRDRALPRLHRQGRLLRG